MFQDIEQKLVEKLEDIPEVHHDENKDNIEIKVPNLFFFYILFLTQLTCNANVGIR